jgi:hypothetical protein
MTAILEVTLAYLFKNARGRDAKCFFTTPAFDSFKDKQAIEVISPDCGPSGATLAVDYTADGSGRIPTLEWKPSEGVASSVKEWLVFTEDVDAPLPTPVVHGFVVMPFTSVSRLSESRSC